MTDSLRPAAILAARLGDRLEIVLPDVEPAIDRDALTAARMELRQVAGLGAGGSMALQPGRWDFGPGERGEGRLDSGEPDTVSFTLTIDDDLAATIVAGAETVRLDDEPVVEPTRVGGRLIDAGPARFVLARPRPARRRSGEIPPGQIDSWVLDPIPLTGPSTAEGDRLVSQRWRLHLGADGLAHRIESGRSHLWQRNPDHPLFGTSVVGVADLPAAPTGPDPDPDPDPNDADAGGLGRVAVPVSIDAVGSSTVLTGPRSHQLAVARQIVLSLAATAHPRDLRIGLQSELADLAFIRHLPHAAAANPTRRTTPRPTLLVIDQERSAGAEPWSDRAGELWPVLADGGSLLILGRKGDLAPRLANWVTIDDATVLAIEPRDGARAIDGVTPVGLGHPLAIELAEKLSTIEVDPSA